MSCSLVHHFFHPACWAGVLAISAGLFGIAGCSKSLEHGSTVTGRVTLDSQPAAFCSVILISNHGWAASAVTGEDGTFRLLCWPGEYQIEISPPQPADPATQPENQATTVSPLKIPAKYRKFGTSGLRASVARGANTLDIPMLTATK